MQQDPYNKANRTTLSQYVTASYLKKIEKDMSSADGAESDCFTQSQDFIEDWTKNVYVSVVRIKNSKAIETVWLGVKTNDPYKVTVFLVPEKGQWTISGAKGPLDK